MKEAEQFKAALEAFEAYEKEDKVRRARIVVAEAAGDAKAVEALKAAPEGRTWYEHYMAAQDTAKALVRAHDIQPDNLKRFL